MPIINTSKNTIIHNKFTVIESIFGKAIGLMFSTKIEKALIFVFEPPRRVDLHMFFVFFPIDVLFLDKEKKVVEMKQNFKPFRFYTPAEKSSYVIELPIKRIEESRTQIGDEIRF